MSAPPFGGWPPPQSTVTSVFGRIGAVVAQLGDYAASKITNDSSVAGATVKDALNSLLGGSGAPVSSVFGRIGAVVATAGDYTSTLITNTSGVAGATVSSALNTLGAALAALNSTSVANVSSVAGATVTAALNTLLAAIPSVPVSSVFARTGAIVATLGDYAASKISNDSTVIGATTKDALNTLRDPVWDPPSSPSADDDEFTTDTLASGVWKLYADTRPVTTPFTRDGAIDVTVTPAAGHYRSSVVNGTLFVQVPAGSVLMTKPLAGALTTKQMWWVSASVLNDAVTPGNSAAVQFMLWLGAAGPIPDNENRMRTGYLADNVTMATRVAGATVTAVTTALVSAQIMSQGSGAVVDHNSGAANNVTGFVFTREGTQTFTSPGQGSAYNTATAWCGMLLSSSVTSLNFGTGGTIFALQFFRRRPITGACTGLAQA